MILQNINYPMPIYKNCTLGEMLTVGGMVVTVEIVILSALAKALFGYAVIGVAITMVSFFHITKFMLGKLEKLKYDKPYAYYKHLFIKKLSKHGLVKTFFLTRVGKWSVRRTN